VMLITLGLINITTFFHSVPNESGRAEANPIEGHSHSQYAQSHLHGDSLAVPPHSFVQRATAWFDRHLGRLDLYQQARPLLIGVVHGLAGSAAVALLVLATIRQSNWAVAYLLVFGAGTIIGMMLITMSLASAFHFLGGGRNFVSQRLSAAAGFVSLAFGVLVAYQVLFVNGLAGVNPHWTPR